MLIVRRTRRDRLQSRVECNWRVKRRSLCSCLVVVLCCLLLFVYVTPSVAWLWSGTHVVMGGAMILLRWASLRVASRCRWQPQRSADTSARQSPHATGSGLLLFVDKQAHAIDHKATVSDTTQQRAICVRTDGRRTRTHTQMERARACSSLTLGHSSVCACY